MSSFRVPSDNWDRLPRRRSALSWGAREPHGKAERHKSQTAFKPLSFEIIVADLANAADQSRIQSIITGNTM